MELPSENSRPLRAVSVEFSPSSGCLGSIVRMVTDFCRSAIDDPKLRSAFEMAAYELTENLVKYAAGETTRLAIALEYPAAGPTLVLRTENAALPERLADADLRLQAAELAECPVKHFDQLVRESLAEPTESRLGLGRLRAEGELNVCHRIDAGVLTIEVSHAVCPSEGVRRS